MDTSLIAVGSAAPGLRLDAADAAAAWGGRGGGRSVAVCGHDEDTLTLAWTAASRALAAADVGPADVDGLWWASTTPPFAGGPNLAYLACALDLDEGVDGALHAGSRMAGVEALLAARDALASGRVGTALVVASDAPVPGLGTAYEQVAGAGAAALVLTAGDAGPARLGTVRSVTRPHLGRYRAPGERRVRDVYDGRLFREQVFLPVLEELAADLAADAVDAWSLPDPDGRLGRRLARRLGIDRPASARIAAQLGDTGAAAALLGLAGCLTAPGRTVALAQGDGRAVGWTVEVDAAVPGAEAIDGLGEGGRTVAYPEALRARGQLRSDTDPIEMGVPPGGAGFVRGNAELLALRGARCEACGTVSTPPSVHPTCVGCGGADLTVVPLPRTGTVHTFVVNQTMPPPFEAPLPLLVVDLDDGARLMVHGTGDGSALEIGDRVELVLRRYAVERGASIYGYKAGPVGSGIGDRPGTAHAVDARE